MRHGFVQTLILILIAAALFSGGFYYQQTRSDVDMLGIEKEETQVVEVESNVTEGVASPEVKKEVIRNEPLRGPAYSEPAEVEGALSVTGILNWTNTYRTQEDLPPLRLDLKLSAAAALKVRDMFESQYFDHTSPSGDGPNDLADEVGYDFVLVAENLALGIFEDDQDVVDAWMDSLGHRENILHERFTDIGIAVMRGVFEGEEIWLAVQEFGLPVSACPGPSIELEHTIQDNRDTLNVLNKDIQNLQQDLDEASQFDPGYNKMVKDYNSLVNVYNALVQETRVLIDRFNVQVRLFNACATNLE